MARSLAASRGRASAEEDLGASRYRSGGTTLRVGRRRAPSGTSTISCACRATMRPHPPAFARSMAARPIRVASTRSNAAGVPPRCTWPSIVTRVSNPVRCSISRRDEVGDAAEAHVAEPFVACSATGRACPPRHRRPRPPRRSRTSCRCSWRRCSSGADLLDVERAAPGSGSRRRRRRCRRRSRSSRRGGPSPRRPSPGRGSRRWCAAGRSRRWRSAPRCGSRT